MNTAFALREVLPEGPPFMWRGHEVRLTVSEARIVRALQTATKHISVLSIYDLIRAPGFLAGDGNEGRAANARTLIKRIRQKYRAVDPSFDCIKTYSGFGYIWEPPA